MRLPLVSRDLRNNALPLYLCRPFTRTEYVLGKMSVLLILLSAITWRQAPKTTYQKAYCSRGEIENRIKELQLGMALDRTSCTSFWANQFRVLLTAAAYALMQEIRLQAKQTTLARAQVTTLREQLLKLSARLEQSVRRIVIHLPQSFAYLDEWTRIARQLGAAPA